MPLKKKATLIVGTLLVIGLCLNVSGAVFSHLFEKSDDVTVLPIVKVDGTVAEDLLFSESHEIFGGQTIERQYNISINKDYTQDVTMHFYYVDDEGINVSVHTDTDQHVQELTISPGESVFITEVITADINLTSGMYNVGFTIDL